MRKPVISKKFFRKIFAHSPEPKHSMATAEGDDHHFFETIASTGPTSPSVFTGASPYSNAALQNLNQQSRYQIRPNNESVISNGNYNMAKGEPTNEHGGSSEKNVPY